MKYIIKQNAIKSENSNDCQTIEYSFGDKDIDLGLATITNRYPQKGYCINLECKELIYVLKGSGKLCFQNRTINFSEGDAILIDKNEKYYWDTTYTQVSMSCTPSWTKEQHKIIE